MLNKLWGKLTGSNGSPTEANTIYSPVTGTVVPLEQVPDPVFSGRMLGDGIAVLPSSGEIVAPFDGKVVSLFPTGHAIGLVSEDGIECLIHIGMDTVELNGQGFTLKVSQGDSVKKGKVLIKADLAAISSAGKQIVTPVVITNTAVWKPVALHEGGEVNAGTDILFRVEAAV